MFGTYYAKIRVSREQRTFLTFSPAGKKKKKKIYLFSQEPDVCANIANCYLHVLFWKIAITINLLSSLENCWIMDSAHMDKKGG